MSESVIADFVAKFNSESTPGAEPVTGRVLLSQKRLVLAANRGEKATVPLSSVLDVAVGQVPADMEEFFDATVTVAFKRDGNRYVAAIEADEEKIEKFSTVLFKALLNGTEMRIKHPARLGGRVTDREFTRAKLAVGSGTVTFKSDERTVGISLSTVTAFDRNEHELGGTTRPMLEVRHVENGQSMLTLAATESARKLSILGRYLRLEYSELMAELEEIDLSAEQKEILVALYSGAGGEGMSIASVVDAEPAQVTMLLNGLEEVGLVTTAGGETTLTPKGRVVVSNHLEDVNV